MEDIKFLKAQLNQQLFMISQPNETVMEAAWQRWDSIGKPLRSLGALERAVVKMAGMENTVNVKMDKRAIVVLCGFGEKLSIDFAVPFRKQLSVFCVTHRSDNLEAAINLIVSGAVDVSAFDFRTLKPEALESLLSDGLNASARRLGTINTVSLL